MRFLRWVVGCGSFGDQARAGAATASSTSSARVALNGASSARDTSGATGIAHHSCPSLRAARTIALLKAWTATPGQQRAGEPPQQARAEAEDRDAGQERRRQREHVRGAEQ